VVLSCTSPFAIGPALAQNLEGEPVLRSAEREVATGSIIVTARRREELLSKTPVAVSSFSEEEIEARGAGNVAALVDLVPNSSFDTTAPLSGSANSASIFIRGIGQTDFAFSTDPGVAVYLDGVYIARSTGSALSLLDVARVEVLRGPQGTIFGRNAIGGAVSVVTNPPEPDSSATGEGGAIVDSQGRRELSGVLNLPIGRDAALRVAGAYRREGSYGRRLIDGKRLGGIDDLEMRGRFRWERGDRLRLDLAVEHANLDDESPVTGLRAVGSTTALGAPTTLFAGLLYNNLIEGADGLAPCERTDFVVPFCGVPGLIQTATLPLGTQPFDARWLTGNAFTTFGTGPTGSQFDGRGASATITWTSTISARWISSFRGFEAEFGRDPDGSPLVIIETMNLLRHRQQSHELQLSDATGPLSWVAGGHWFKERGSDRVSAPFIDETFQIFANLGRGCSLLPGVTGAAVPIFVPVCPNIFRIDHAGKGTQVDNRSISLFGEATLEMTEWLSLSGGLRWTRDRKKIDISGFLVGGLPVSPSPVAKASFSRLSPRVILQLEPSRHSMVYGSFSTGFKSGGFNQRYGAPIAAPTSFKPEAVDAFELGYRFTQRRLRLGATAFWSRYRDVQAVVFDGGIPRTVNAAAGRSRGIELEGVFAPRDGLTVGASYGFLDAQFTSLDSSIIGSFGQPIVNPLRTSYRFVNSPRHTVAGYVEYAYGLAQRGALVVRADLSHRSSVANDAVNTAELVQGPVTLVNARLTYRPRGARWSASLFGTNLLDERHVVSGVADPAGFGAAEINVARTRRCGASAKIFF